MTVSASNSMPTAIGAARTPDWARWRGADARRYTVGIEEEVMLLSASEHSLAQCSDTVLDRLTAELRPSVSPETHAAVIELTTGVHPTTAGAVMELSGLRRRLAHELSALDVIPGSAGMHALATDIESEVSDADRYRLIAASMRSLARRAPTMALHVHVGIPESETAIRVLNRLRENVPMLLALSANSPFTGGRDSGFCSARTLVFDGFPRTGTPRAFSGYEDYVETIDGLVALGAFPDYTFLWWDVRLQPALGTVEVRVMDAQTTAGEAAPLVALVQSLARRELEGEPLGPPIGPEALAENRFLAARDGLEARLIDPRRRRVVALRALVHEVLEDCMPHAVALGCAAELEQVRRVAAVNGAERQRSWASAGGVTSIAPRLAAWFTRDRRR